MAKIAKSWASSDAVRVRMRGNKSRDTRPELVIRRALHARGLRYRVDYQPLPWLRRRADIVFTKAKVAVFVDGCFWHGCPLHHTLAATNAAFWADKVQRNRRRDNETNRILHDAGWRVIRVWEYEEVAEALERITSAVLQR